MYTDIENENDLLNRNQKEIKLDDIDISDKNELNETSNIQNSVQDLIDSENIEKIQTEKIANDSNKVIGLSKFENPNYILDGTKLIRYDLEAKQKNNSFRIKPSDTHYYKDKHGNTARLWFDNQGKIIKKKDIYKTSHSIDKDLDFDVDSAENIDKDNPYRNIFVAKTNNNVNTNYKDPVEIAYMEEVQYFGVPQRDYIGMRKIEEDKGVLARAAEIPRGFASNVVNLGVDASNYVSNNFAEMVIRARYDGEEQDDMLNNLMDSSIDLRETQQEELEKLGLTKREDDSWLFDVGGVVGSVATSMLLGNPALTGVLYFAGSQQNLSEELYKNGITGAKATAISNGTAVLTGAIEYVFDDKMLKFIKTDKVLGRLTKSAISEAIEESSQSLVEDGSMVTFGGRKKALQDIVKDGVVSGIYGGLGGGIGVGLYSVPDIAKKTSNYILNRKQQKQDIYNKARSRGFSEKESVGIVKNVDTALNNKKLLNELKDIASKQSQPETYYNSSLDENAKEIKRQIDSGEASNNSIQLWESIDKADLEEYNKQKDSLKQDLLKTGLEEVKIDSIIKMNDAIIQNQAIKLGTTRSQLLKISPLPRITKDYYKNSLETEEEYLNYINNNLNNDYIGYNEDGSKINFKKEDLQKLYKTQKSVEKDLKVLYKKQKENKTLLERVKELGGIYDIGGDIKSIVDKRGDAKFIISKKQFKRKINKETKEEYSIDTSADNIFKQLINEGYQMLDDQGIVIQDYRNVDGVYTLIEAIRQEIDGSPIYKDNTEIDFEIERLNQFEEELDRMGISTEDLENINNWHEHKRRVKKNRYELNKEQKEKVNQKNNPNQDYLFKDQNVYNQAGKVKTKTEAFKKWFDNSQVVNDKGEPLVVYHGTNENFNTFNKNYQSNGWLGKGFYFTTNKKLSKEYGKTKSFYIKSERLYKIDGNNYTDLYNQLEKDFNLSKDIATDSSKVQEILAKNGYDGIYLKHWDLGEIYSIFNPNQIKSTDNKGTFSLDDDNIYNQSNNQYNTYNPTAPRANIDLNHNIITLFENADASSIVHEMGHYYLNMLKKLERTGNKIVKKQLNELRKSLNLDYSKYNKLTKEDKRNFDIEEQELFARSYEAYLMERSNDINFRENNKSYIVELFDNFRQWLKDVYESVLNLNVNLNPELTKWFDDFVVNERYYTEDNGNKRVNLKSVQENLDKKTDEALKKVKEIVNQKIEEITKETEQLVLNQSPVNELEKVAKETIEQKQEEIQKEKDKLKNIIEKDVDIALNDLELSEVYSSIIRERVQEVIKNKADEIINQKYNIMTALRGTNLALQKRIRQDESSLSEASDFAFKVGRENIALRENVKRQIDINEKLKNKNFGLTKANEGLMDDYLERMYEIRSEAETALNQELEKLRETFVFEENKNLDSENKNKNNYVKKNNSNDLNYWDSIEEQANDYINREYTNTYEENLSIRASALFEEYMKLDPNATREKIVKDISMFLKKDFDVLEYVKNNYHQKFTEKDLDEAVNSIEKHKEDSKILSKIKKRKNEAFSKDNSLVVNAIDFIFTNNPVVEGVGYSLGSINNRIKSISENIYSKIIKTEGAKYQQLQKYSNRVLPFLEKMEKIKKQEPREYNKFVVFWNWKDKAGMVNFLEKYNLTEEFKEVNNVTNELYERQIEVAIDLPYSEMYMPSKVRDLEGLIEEIEKDMGKDFINLIEKDAINKGISPDLKDPQYANFINQSIRGFVPSGIILKPENYTKRQTMEKVLKNVKYIKFYQDPLMTLVDYINGVTRNVLDRKLFGKLTAEDNEIMQKLKRERKKIDTLNKTDAKKYKENQLKRLKSRKALIEHDLERMQYARNKDNENNNKNVETSINNKNDLDLAIEDIKYTIGEIDKQINFFNFQKPEKIKELRYAEIEQNIEKLNEQLSPESQQTLEESIASFVKDENLTNKKIEKLKGDLKALYGPKKFSQNPLGKTINNLQSATSIAYLSGLSTAIKQTGDIAYTLFDNGLHNTMSAIFKSEEYFKAQKDFFEITGLDNNLVSEVDVNNKLYKIGKQIFKLTLFNKIDKFGKNTKLRAEFLDIRDKLKKGNPETIKELETFFDNDYIEATKEIIEFDGSKPMSEDLLSYLLMKLSDNQPIFLGNKTRLYLDSPNLRFMFALKSYFVTQLNHTASITKKLGKGDIMGAAWDLLRLQCLIWALNIPTSYLIDALFKIEDEEDEEDFWEDLGRRMRENVVLNNALNRYALGTFTGQGPVAYIYKQITPIFLDITTAFWQDLTSLSPGGKEFKNRTMNRIGIYRNAKNFFKKLLK